MGNLTKALATEIARSIELYDLTIRESRDAISLPNLEQLDPLIRQAAMFSRMASAPHMTSVMVLDENGTVRFNSDSATPRQANYADRDYFSYHRDHDTGGLYVGRPFQGGRDGPTDLMFSRRISRADGSFGGVVAAGVDLDYFRDLFGHLDLGNHGSVALISTDGTLLVRLTPQRDDVGGNVSQSTAFKQMVEKRAGIAEGTSSIDGVRRIYAFQQIGDLPLIVASGSGRDDVFAFWRAKAALMTAAFSLLLGLAALLAAACRKELRRSAAAEVTAQTAATEARQAHESTNEILARLNAVFDHAVDAHFTAYRRADGQFAYEALNPTAEMLTGLQTQDVVDRTPLECLPPHAALSVDEHWTRCLRDRAVCWYSHALDLPAGRRHWEAVLVPLLDARGEVCRLIGTARDVTDRKQMEEALLALNDELEHRVAEAVGERESALLRAAVAERMQALGQLAGGIAHDFNNVLQGVSGCAALIERRSQDPAACRRLARMVTETTQRGASITRRLLAFSRRDELRTEPVAVGELLEGLAEILTHTLGSLITVQVAVENDVSLVLADKGQFETVLLNLATNARDAMAGGGSLTFSATNVAVDASHVSGLAPGRYVELLVADTGAGMDRATLARVTEPFFTTKPTGQGTGLGLSMAKGFAEQSDGLLTIASELGKGTVVTIWLPQALPGSSPLSVSTPVSAPVSAPVSSGVRNKRVLVVDDDMIVRETLAEHLDEEYSVVCAASGADALAILQNGELVDGLVTDLTMPGMSGLTLIQEAQSRQPGLVAILLTGHAGDSASLAVGGAVSGAYSLLRKPVTAAQLSDRLASLLASPGTRHCIAEL